MPITYGYQSKAQQDLFTIASEKFEMDCPKKNKVLYGLSH